MKRKLIYLMALILCQTLMTTVTAQNVTISPQTGNLIAASTDPGEVGFRNGWSAMWKHEQLPLTLTVADYPDLTSGGEFTMPAGNISKYNNKLVIMGGSTVESHFIISLPKGYRITGYTMVLQNNLNGKTVNNMAIVGIDKTLYETKRDFNTTAYLAKTENMGTVNDNKDYTISRTSLNPDDMGNQLYFKMTHAVTGFYGVTIKSIEITFTAEGSFDALVAPTVIDNTGKSFVYSPFTTAKVDIGDIKPHQAPNGNTYYSYDYKNVKDLIANNVIYEKDAVVDGKIGDANAGHKSIKSIYNNGNMYFGLGNHTYFVETPTEVTTQDNTTSPIAYRIVGVSVKGTYGEPATSSNQGFVITTMQSGTKYYLNTQGKFSSTEPTVWKVENERIKSGNYYLNFEKKTKYNNQDDYVVTTTTRPLNEFNIDNNGHIYYRSGGIRHYLCATTGINDPTFENSTTGACLREFIKQPAFTPHDYTLKVYDKTGTTVLKEMNISSSNKNETFKVEGLNNDAVKLEVSGLPENERALVTVNLILESLNPYINRLNLVCQEKTGHGRKIQQQFTANDFAVRGGKFIFYVPEDFNTPCKITFTDLFSNYGDETYYNGITQGHHGRYSLVKSPYWDNNQNLYATSYDPNASYETKIHTDVSGTKAFRFNNADQLSNTSGSTTTGHYQEYPFTLQKYAEAGGNFVEVEIDNNQTKQSYLFTCDETRYNIAPTTASEHRYYAYYLMDIELNKKTYTPIVEWTKVYEGNQTCYNKTGKEDISKDQWGLKLKTTEASPEGQYGYLTLNQVRNLIETNDKQITKDQILYVDGSELLELVTEEAQSSTSTDGLENLRLELGSNALIYLPKGSTYNKDNFAYKTESGFQACNNIILTDKKPFFAPYEIKVDAANKAVYTRQITWQANGKVTNATLILPYALKVDATGLHTNQDDNCSFKLHKMNATNCLSISGAEDAQAKNYFGNITMDGGAITVAKANCPYIVEVISAPTEENKSFVAEQKGATIVATTTANGMKPDYTFDGETASGSIDGNTYTFVNHGSFTGKKLDKKVGYFYFAKNMFLNSKNLREQLTHLIVYPFRSYYTYTGNGKLNSMEIVYGENTEVTDGITETETQPDMVIAAGVGTITVSTTVDNNISIRNLNGMCVKAAKLNAGETKTFDIQAGIYIINGVKIIVK